MKDYKTGETSGGLDLIALIEEAFKKTFGNEILGVACRPMTPHEALVEVRVRRVVPTMDDLARALADELDELGRKVTIRIYAQAPAPPTLFSLA